MTQVSTKPTERPRQREPREGHEPGAGAVVPWEQGRLFAQLFSDSDEGSGTRGGLSGMKESMTTSMIEALAEQLAPRVMGSAQWPLQAVLYLPRLGRINASVRREQNAWSIDLEAEDDATARWLRGTRQQCEGRFAAALGQPVSLFIPNAGSA